ncbi:MAG: response regulator [Planctomycetes bacterium]|nr:response regulator [Planctomycetota bacterium]
MAKILIVDDEEEVVDSLRMILEAEGHVVDSASSAKEGLRKLQQDDPPALVIVDVMMETLTAGAMMVRQIREATPSPDIPVIILSSVNREFPGLRWNQGDLDDGWLPANRFIEKPYKLTEIQQAVRELLRIGSGGNGPEPVCR